MIGSAEETRIQTGNPHCNCISAPFAPICTDKLYLGFLYMTTHTGLCNIVLTKIIGYWKEAAHLADAFFN